jgi:hypothetical protein
MLARDRVVGVEVADGEPAAVEEHRHRVGFPGADLLVGPVHPNRDRPLRGLQAVVLDAQIGVQGPARKVAQPPARLLDPAVDGQLERDGFQNLLQDGVDGWFVGWGRCHAANIRRRRGRRRFRRCWGSPRETAVTVVRDAWNNPSL